MNEGITRCATIDVAAHLRSVVRAALPVVLLAVTSAAADRPAPATTAAARSPATLAASRPAPAAPAAAVRKVRLEAWRWAFRQRGRPYIWGGTGPRGFDCSGLVYAAYRASGVILPRTTTEILHSNRFIRIRKSQARRGDLAFFGRDHVELYAWGNWTFGAEHTGTRIGFHLMSKFWHPTMYLKVRL